MDGMVIFLHFDIQLSLSPSDATPRVTSRISGCLAWTCVSRHVSPVRWSIPTPAGLTSYSVTAPTSHPAAVSG